MNGLAVHVGVCFDSPRLDPGLRTDVLGDSKIAPWKSHRNSGIHPMG